MWRVAWASVRGHATRTVATALSVVFGVAFVTGTFVFTDTVEDAFEQLFGSTVEGADLVVSSTAAGTSGGGALHGGVPPDVVDQVKDVDGVADAEARYRGMAKLARDDGSPLVSFGAVLQGIDAPSMEGAVELRAGRLPADSRQVAIDASSASRLGKAVGDDATLLLNGPPQTYRISGIIAPPEAVRDLAGSTTVVFSDAVAAQLYGRDGATYIAVQAADGVAADSLRTRIANDLGAGYEVLTIDELVTDAVTQVGDFLGFITRGLLVFAGAALLVGAIIIFNTFGITVAQRTRELALVQAIGAQGRQVMRAVLLEALVIGVAGSAVGVAVGVLGALGLRTLLRLVNLPLPSTDMVVAPRTAAIGVIVGVVVTVVAAVGPAVRASRHAPMEAMRSVSPASGTAVSTPRLLTGTLAAGLAAATLIGAGLDRGGVIALGVGAVATMVALVLLAPLGAAPVTALVGWPVRTMRRLPGVLARANAIRNPGRTAATATALLVGLALVTFVLILVSSFRSSLDRVIVERFRADYQVQAVDQVGYPASVTAAVRDVDGVALTSAASVLRGDVDGSTRTMFAVDGATLPQVYDVGVVAGDLAGLADGGVAVSHELGIPLGASVGVRTGTEPPTARPIVALTDDLHLPGTTRVGQVLIDRSTVGEDLAARQDLVAFVTVAPDAAPAVVRQSLDEAVADQPDARIADTAQLRAQVRDETERLLGLVIGLVLLSVVVAFVGVINALGLSVVERTDELGLLQALGMTQRQARQMIRWESVIITVLGTVTGVALGAAFGWLGVRVLRDEGLTTFTIPVPQIVIAVGIVLVAGVIASVAPARRASHVDVLRAVTIE